KKKRDELRRELAAFDGDRPSLPVGVSARDVGPAAPPTTLPKWGLVVEPGVPSVFDPRPLPVTPPAGRPSTGRRTALAEWLVRPIPKIGCCPTPLPAGSTPSRFATPCYP